MSTIDDQPPADDETDRRKKLMALARDPTDTSIRSIRAIAELDPSADLRAYARRVLDALKTGHRSQAAQPDVATLVESLERMTHAAAIRELAPARTRSLTG